MHKDERVTDAMVVDEEALDKAAREGYAVRCKTHGPRVLQRYASDDIMQMQLDNARVIVSAYLAALASAEEEKAVEQEPVAIYHGNGLIDCGDAGHYNIELLKLIPAGTKLYTHPPRSALVASPEAGEYRHALERIANASVVAWNVATATEALNTARAIAASALSRNSSTEETVGDAIIAKGGDHG